MRNTSKDKTSKKSSARDTKTNRTGTKEEYGREQGTPQTNQQRSSRVNNCSTRSKKSNSTKGCK